MSAKPVTWKTTTADFTYDPERGCVYRAIFGQASHWFCGALPRHLETVEEVKQAIRVKMLAEAL
ncbi:hypothetical protein G8C42_02605 [Citrobacter freundii]|uniref:hypothetical protein n=1 Tax=Citrobacter freundii TaxID=546 RepID=UPI001884512B|nr:hypothetical protein [Citrobacter freundii]MBE9969181.1 hypothetical protein [Citrobacter freundii]MBE9975567.1 hypothetical protein [Citrobacter freundii]MBE9985154.1 hypothetical protein [Citrobacter freundii]MBF0064522.1 hypothetical protein [Citrobacter freundii]HAT4379524.1 hypothetical protein [Citrobacter freundii]